MSWSKAEALRYVERPCKEIGREWSKNPRLEYYDTWADNRESLELCLQAIRRIDLYSPEWAVELTEDQAQWTLSIHQAWTALKWRNWWLNENHKRRSKYRVYTSSLAKHFRNELERCDVINDEVSKLDREALLMFMSLIAGELIEAWKIRQGRELPDGLQVAIVFLAQTCVVWHDELLDGPRSIKDTRGGKYFLARELEEITFQILDDARSEIKDGHPIPWDGFDLYRAITVSVEALALSENHRAAEREVEAAKQAMREALDEIAANPPDELLDWQAIHPHPAPTPYGLSPEGAERWVCEWMLHMGAVGAECTQYVADGGIDVYSHRFIAQVKHYTGTVPVAAIREFLGVAYADELERLPLFFTTGKYPEGALELAERRPIALFRFEPETASVIPHNMLAERHLAMGFL